MASKEPDDDDEWCEKQNVEPCSIPGKTNLRSLPKRMNTWPKKNLMTMTSEVKMPLRLRPDQKALVLHPWCWHQWESKFENWKIEQWRYPYELKHKRWLRVGPKRDQKHLNCTRGAGNFDLCLLCPNWTKLLPYGFFALWLLRLDFTV